MQHYMQVSILTVCFVLLQVLYLDTSTGLIANTPIGYVYVIAWVGVKFRNISSSSSSYSSGIACKKQVNMVKQVSV